MTLKPPITKHGHIWAVGACLLAVALAWPLQRLLDAANIVMLFLLAVLLVARYCGRGPAVTAAFLSVALFDFFFVPPQFTFAVNDAQYLVTFAVMLAAALVTGTLTAGLRREAETAAERESRALALYEMARELAGTLHLEQVADVTGRFLRQAIDINATILVTDNTEHLHQISPAGPRCEIHLAQMALVQDNPVECSALGADGYAYAYFALRAPTRQRGVLAVAPLTGDLDTIRPQYPLIEATASLAAIAIERLHYAEAAQAAEVDASSQRLRASLLSAISHDLRTPLTSLRGMADTLALARGNPAELTAAIRDQAMRLSRMVENLLDMARLQSGRIVLKKEWLPLEEIIGSSLKLLDPILEGRQVDIALEPELPLVEFDAVLIERVFCNLIENAAKYSPPGSALRISAAPAGHELEIGIADRGPGFPPGREEAVFDLFERNDHESARTGVGLGLAICRSIVDAHHGRIWATNREGGGAIVHFTLPLGSPPVLDEEREGNLP